MASQFKTFVAGDSLTASELNSYFMKQAVIVADSSADYPAAPVEGMTCYDKALDSLVVYAGSAWVQIAGVGAGADTAYTPTLTQTSATAATVTEARYVRYGNVVEAWVYLSVTGTGGGSTVTVTLPVTSTGHATGAIVGSGYIYDSSAGDQWPVAVQINSSTTVAFLAQATTTGGRFGVDPNVTLGAGDEVRFHVRYTVA